MIPPRIRARFLRSRKPETRAVGLAAFAFAGDSIHTKADETQHMSCRESDIECAIVAAERAGLDRYRVEIAPDGTIAIVVGGVEHSQTDP